MFDFEGIVAAVCAELTERGFSIEKRGEGAPNVVAVKNGQRVLVKTTGQTNPEGKPFTDSQVRAHIARIVYDALKLTQSKAKGEEIWVAIPADEEHERRARDVGRSLRKLGIGLIRVGEDGTLSPFI